MGRCRLKKDVKGVPNKNNFNGVRLKLGCRDTQLGNNITKTQKEVITIEINVVVTLQGQGRGL